MPSKFNTTQFLKLCPVILKKFHYFDTLESTNDYAKTLVNQHQAASGTLILAEHQTMGRGRGNHTWLSTARESLLFTLILEPEIEPLYWNRFSLVMGVAIANVIQGLTQNPSTVVGLKWPNDVWLNGKKCAGILIEALNDRLLIGVGVNVSHTTFPLELSSSATSLLSENITVPRELLLASVVNETIQLGTLVKDHFQDVVGEYNKYCILKGKQITFNAAGKAQQGIAMSVGSSGALIVADGERTTAYNEASNILTRQLEKRHKSC